MKYSLYKRILLKILNKCVDFISSETYLKLKFYIITGRELNLARPSSFNEKLQWLKLNDHHPEYTLLVDKYMVKEYVSKRIGTQYLIPTIGVWDNADSINFDTLPNKFVLKCTGDSGSVIICKDKKKLDYDCARLSLTKSLGQNFYKFSKEYPYRDVKPRIIAEEYKVDERYGELMDYKFFCFNGQIAIVQLDYDRFAGHKRNLYDPDWNLLPVELEYPSDRNRIFEKPINYEKMKEIASTLSKGIAHVRIDLYNINGAIYFGEMTFFHGSGFEHFKPLEWDYKLGDLLLLPE